MTNINDDNWRNEEALRKYQIIAPLLPDDLDPSERSAKRRDIIEKSGIPERTIYRYEQLYREGGFEGLKPKIRERNPSKLLPEDFQELIEEAKILKREVPTRSVHQIIRILELEDRVKAGVLKRSTVQRYLYKAGFGKKQLKKFNDAHKSSSRRFCKPNRMMLVQGDIKYGPTLPIGKNGKAEKTYLSSLVDDHSRLILASGFYDNEGEEVVEDTVRKAILKYGKPDAFYFDNGSGYKSNNLTKSLLSLGIKVLHAKPYACQSKGKVEKFNNLVNSFINEAKLKKYKTLEELNSAWQLYVEDYYHEDPHDGIKEYYLSIGMSYPAEGITPRQEWNRDSRALVFLDAGTVGDAFMHTDEREVDKGACISFKGRKYEVSTSLIGAKVTVTYDPMNTDTITISYPGIDSFKTHPLCIGSFCDKKPEIPQCMLPIEPETSRFLDALAKKHESKQIQRANAISFGAYKKQGGDE